MGKMCNEVMPNDDQSELENSIKGRVKTMRYKEYDSTLVKKAMRKVLSGSGTWQFDVMGHITSGRQFDAKGTLAYSMDFKYEGKNLAASHIHDVKAFAKGVSHTIKYYANGRKFEDYVVDSFDGDVTRQVYQYDDNGFVVTKTYSNGQRELRHVDQVAEGDSVKSLANVHWSFPDVDENHLHLTEIAVDVYDNHHNHTESLAWGPDSVHTKHYKAAYDAARNNTVQEVCNDTGTTPLEKTVMKYDANGLCTKLIHYNRKVGNHLLTAKYDDHFNRLEQRYFINGKLNDRGTSFHAYEYDIKGNITKRTTYTLTHCSKVPRIMFEAVYEYDG
ncbi:MAG: hypothetical protein H7257_13375 [Taibaiella sp.]|nr:hypothetical protein [Taibaiella sp.]